MRNITYFLVFRSGGFNFSDYSSLLLFVSSAELKSSIFFKRRISHDNSFRFLKWDQDSINGFRLLDSEVRISVRHVTTYNYKTLTALELNNSFRFLVFISSAIS
ncbi:unnamed protein product [Rhizophagus irregularis]|nr:unnamed protein product [Rhizophagus irregularis]